LLFLKKNITFSLFIFGYLLVKAAAIYQKIVSYILIAFCGSMELGISYLYCV